ncbi:hypothetical protein GX48_01689 [Paracoccidioides brasiliensis]|nr:hypothetical protein GX48_01689 [Paracoccidioides brasiliensis]
MKGALLFSAAAAVAGTAFAHAGHHQHKVFHQRRGYETSPAPKPEVPCGCTTKVVTYYGQPTLIEEKTTTIKTTSTIIKTISVTNGAKLPTPEVTVYPTPGTYTIPAKTVIVTKETTVCAATSTAVSPGDHTYGGVTTVVTAATTVTCDIAVVKPAGSTVVSVIEQTTYVCPSAGTYTVAPTTTRVPSSTVFVYPTPATYTTGTYTLPAQTVTATQTSYVYICPAPTGGHPKPTAEPTSPPDYPTNPPKESKAPTPEKTKAPGPEKSSTPKNPPNYPTLGGGEKWGMTYSPYTNGGQCKGAAAVAADIALIKSKGFKTVRVYGTDCDSLQNIGSACNLNGLEMILGVFVSGAGIPEAKKQVQDIVNWGKFDRVNLIVVGNEALHQGTADAGSLSELLEYARGRFRGAGYNGPITTTEPLNKWQESGKALCPHIDIIGANIHCYFNPEVIPSNCGSFIKSQMDILGKICPGKEVINLETGWPSSGGNNGKAIASKEAQRTAIKSIIKEVGSKSVFFSFTDDKWKQPGSYGVEQYWGCGDLF